MTDVDELANPLEFLRAMCRACGLDPDKDFVKSITITLVACEMPRIVVERFPTKAEMDKTSEEVRKACAELRVKPEVVVLDTSYGSSYSVVRLPDRYGIDYKFEVHDRPVVQGGITVGTVPPRG